MNTIHKPLLLSTLIATLTCPSIAVGNDTTTTAYINGNIYTGTQPGQYSNSLIIKDGVFTYVGNDALQTLKDTSNVTIIDLNGKTVTPGLYDSHIHPIGAGEKLLSNVTSHNQHP